MRGARARRGAAATFGSADGAAASPFVSTPLEGLGRGLATPKTMEAPSGIGAFIEEDVPAQGTPLGASSGLNGERSASPSATPRSSTSLLSPALAAQADNPEPQTGCEEHSEELAGACQADVEARVRKMVLSPEKPTGTVVASGMGAAARIVTNGFVITIMKAVREVFKHRSKDEKDAMWGKVSQEESIGYVICDMLDYPELINAGEARELGDISRKRGNAAELKEQSEVKDAGRRVAGAARQAAVATARKKVLDAEMEGLPLPEKASRKRTFSASVVRALPSAPAPSAEPAPKHGPTSQRAKLAGDRLKAAKTRVRRRHINARCTCAEFGEPFHNEFAGVKSREFVEHAPHALPEVALLCVGDRPLRAALHLRRGSRYRRRGAAGGCAVRVSWRHLRTVLRPALQQTACPRSRR